MEVKVFDVDTLDWLECVITLRRGTAWMLYFDDGPGGPCGQSMRVTCPHACLHTWPSEDEMRNDIARGFGRNNKARVMYGVVGEYTANGVFRVMVHG